MSTSFICLTDDDVMDLVVVMKLEEGVVHIIIGDGRLGQEHQDIDQVRPA